MAVAEDSIAQGAVARAMESLRTYLDEDLSATDLQMVGEIIQMAIAESLLADRRVRPLKPANGDKQPPTLDDAFVKVVYLKKIGAVHKTKRYVLDELSWDDQLDHLEQEVAELNDANTDAQRLDEIADCVGVLLHMATFFGDDPATLAQRILNKLALRFETKTLVDHTVICVHCGFRVTRSTRDKAFSMMSKHLAKCKESPTAKKFEKLVGLVKHIASHEIYKNCGRELMTPEQKQLYDEIVKQS